MRDLGVLMCAQYMVKGPARAIAERYFAKISPELKAKIYETRIVPFTLAPILVNRDHDRVLTEMRFHLTPSWAKEAKVKWATYNARLEDVETKASFKKAFKAKHCIVPINGFIEPIYKGEHAGFMVEFNRTDESWLLAAGIYDEWVHPGTGEILESFSILTDPPEEFVAKIGHDRQPLFLDPNHIGTWLEAKDVKPAELREWLRHHRHPQELFVRHDRPMRPGWEKRIPEE